jgi:two-component system cell cycle sensor histidine kinase/response regulator CckA
MREGGRLEIRVRPADGARGVVVEVQDSGEGMDDATLARVFAPFFTTKGAAGSGIGLASVRQTLEADGGEISVRSALGRGTCVQLRWPAADTDEHAVASASVSTVPLVHSGSVLVVDEDAAVRTTVATLLRRRGLTVFEAASREEALQLTSHHKVDVVVTDGLVSSGESALSFVRQLRESAPSLRILLCSGCDAADFQAARVLADAALPKPFDLASLFDQLEPLMRLRPGEVQVA